MAYIYKHIRKDTGEVFYIGIAKSQYRLKSKQSRNSLWLNIVSKTEYEAVIIQDNLTWDEACKIEKELIRLYGRRDLNMGNLVNMTNGGDGLNNPNEKTRIKMSESQKGKKHTEESKRKIGEAARKNMLGRKLSDDTKKCISESLKGHKQSSETKEKRRLSLIGKNTGPKSEETKRKISEANKQKIREKLICPHCGKIGAINGMKQWHFNNCKNK